MKTNFGTIGRWVGYVAAALSLAGCGGEQGEFLPEDVAEGEVAEVGQEVQAPNSFTMNSFTMNSFTMNSFTMNSFTMNSFTMNSFTMNGIVDALQDPNGREFVRYAYSCAMPEGTTETIVIDEDTSLTLQGGLGLAPEWGEENGSCDQECQEWVSACMIARVNAFGQQVQLSLRGSHPALQNNTSPAEITTFNHHEGRFWGNILGGTTTARACYGTASDIFQVTRRACASPGGYCPIDVAGSCNTACTMGADGLVRCDNNPRFVEVYLAPTNHVCGNYVCETGEDTINCDVDCSPSTLRQDPNLGSPTSVIASAKSSLSSSGYVVTLGIAATSNAVNLGMRDYMGYPASTPAASSRDYFLVRQQENGVVWAKRFAIPTSAIGVMDPVAVTVHERAGDPHGWILVAGKGFVAMHDDSTGNMLWRTETNMKHDGLWMQGDLIVTAGPYGEVSGANWSQLGNAIMKLRQNNSGSLEDLFYAPVTPKAAKWLHGSTLYQATGQSNAIKVTAISTTTGLVTASATLPVPNVVSPKPVVVRAYQPGSDPAGHVLFVAGSGGNGATGTSGFLMSLGSALDVHWNKQFVTQGDKQFNIKSLSLASNIGHVAIGGDFSGTQDFGGTGGSNPILRGFGNNLDAFTAKYERSNGSLSRIFVHGGPGADVLDAMDYDRFGALWTFGQLTGKALIAGTYKTSNDGYNGADLFTLKSPIQNTYCSPPAW